MEIFNDINLDSQGQTNERIFNQNYSNLASNDSLLITKKIYAAAVGTYGFVAQSNFTQDEKSSNDKAVLSYNVSERPASFNDIVINEIMYAPSTDEPEWIEIVNKSNRAYNLKNWKIDSFNEDFLGGVSDGSEKTKVLRNKQKTKTAKPERHFFISSPLPA